jgi:predicted dehydrogenase
MPSAALVGCAHIHTPSFVSRLRARDDIRVVAVWDPDRSRAEKYAADLQAQVRDQVEEIWTDDGIDAVIICSETDRHEELVGPAVAAGLNLFVEKPLGLGGDDANRMAALIEEAGVLFQTGYFQRGLPAHLFIRDQIRAGTFGTISRVRASFCHSGSMRDLFSPDWLWMTDRERAGVGAFGDLGAHVLDLLIWMLGGVSAVTTAIRPVTGRYGEDCDESGEALLRFESGVIGSIAAGWVDVANPITFEISGTLGHAYVRNRIEVFIASEALGSDGSDPWPDLPKAWPHAFELFLDALNGKKVPLVGAREAAYRNMVMEAMYRSAGERNWVDVGKT